MSFNSTRLPQNITNDAHNPMRNPNDRKNRVPGEVEREGLRKLIKSNLDVERVLGEQVSRLQASQRALSDRLMRQQLELEATQAELFETNSLRESLEIQRTTIQKRTLSLRALIHPIRRFPAEIMKYIFESIVEMSVEKLQAASKLSSVCQSWRKIAFDTPRLWCTMRTFAVPSTETLWPHWISLVKSIPVDLCINDLEEANSALLRSLQLFRIPNLKVLALNLSYPAIIDELCEDIFGKSYMPLRQLSISLDGQDWTELHLDSLMEHVSSLTKLKIGGSISLHAQPNFTSSLVTLILEQMEELDFQGVMQFLPLLETLELDRVTFEVTFQQRMVTLNSIRRLRFFSTPIFDELWVLDLSFPRLISLMNGDEATPLFSRFVNSHPSIRELDCCNEDHDLVEEISASSEVTHLSITSEFAAFVDWRAFGMAEVPFPSLQVLMLGDHEMPPDVLDFEGVIRARCLPMNHPRSLLEHENLLFRELRVLVGTREWEGEAWALHALAREASREVIPYEAIQGWSYVVLQWNPE